MTENADIYKQGFEEGYIQAQQDMNEYLLRMFREREVEFTEKENEND